MTQIFCRPRGTFLLDRFEYLAYLKQYEHSFMISGIFLHHTRDCAFYFGVLALSYRQKECSTVSNCACSLSAIEKRRQAPNLVFVSCRQGSCNGCFKALPKYLVWLRFRERIAAGISLSPYSLTRILYPEFSTFII